MRATGKLQPGLARPEVPKWARSSGVSGIENDEPSTRKVRWPRQVPCARVSGARASVRPRSTAR